MPIASLCDGTHTKPDLSFSQGRLKRRESASFFVCFGRFVNRWYFGPMPMHHKLDYVESLRPTWIKAKYFSSEPLVGILKILVLIIPHFPGQASRVVFSAPIRPAAHLQAPHYSFFTARISRPVCGVCAIAVPKLSNPSLRSRGGTGFISLNLWGMNLLSGLINRPFYLVFIKYLWSLLFVS